jgi:hypothetical protein
MSSTAGTIAPALEKRLGPARSSGRDSSERDEPVGLPPEEKMMKRLRILFFAFFLLIPAFQAQAQNAAADKSWNSFWTKFSTAVKQKNRVALKSLMVSEREFYPGGGGGTRDEWLNLVSWSELQKSVRSGIKADRTYGKPGRTTRDNWLIFAYTGGRWRFMGERGD